jgi:hypothetical protein
MGGADVPVRIRDSVVQIQSKRTYKKTVVAVAADNRIDRRAGAYSSARSLPLY